MGVSKGGEGFVEEVTEVSPGPGPSDRFLRNNLVVSGKMINFAAVISNSKKL